jgi:hypothetical protein
MMKNVENEDDIYSLSRGDEGLRCEQQVFHIGG